jgi:hypothetical protein
VSGVAVRLGRVGRQVNTIDLDKIGCMVSRAKLERRIAGDLEVVADGEFGSLAIENAQSCRWRQAGSQAGGDSRESHGTWIVAVFD